MLYIEFFKKNSDGFTAIGVILTFIVSIITLIATLHSKKTKQYIDTITRSRIEWIGHLRKLTSKYLSMLSINLNTTTNTIESEKNYREILNLSNEIKLMLNFKSDFDNKIIKLLSEIIADFDQLRTACECINILSRSGINKDIFENPYFVKNLINYAKDSGYDVTNEIKDYNCKYVSNLFKDVIKTPDDKDKFIRIFLSSQEQLIHGINDNCSDLSNKVRIYLKSEWNRVKIESQGKRYSSKKQEKEINKLSKYFSQHKFESID